MRRHDPAAFLTVGNDRRRVAQRRAGLRQRIVPEVGEVSLADDLREIRSCGGENAVIPVRAGHKRNQKRSSARVSKSRHCSFPNAHADGGCGAISPAIRSMNWMRLSARGIEDGLAGTSSPLNAGSCGWRPDNSWASVSWGRKDRGRNTRIFAELHVSTRFLRLLLIARRAAHAAKSVHQLHGSAAHGLVHAALERRLVIEKGRAVPVHAEEARR